MTDDISRLSDTDLRSLFKNSSFVLRTIADGLSIRPDAQDALSRLMSPDDILATISELAATDPELMRLVLRASVMSLTNVQSAENVRAELRRRMAPEN